MWSDPMPQSQAHEREQVAGVFLTRVFMWMFAGLALSGLVAYGVAEADVIPTRGMMIGLIVGELALVVVLSAAIQRLAPAVAAALFLGYAVLNGVTLSIIFQVYTAESIEMVFFSSAAIFGAMATYGAVTKRDLTSWGSFFFMGLVAVLVASLINFFVRSSALQWALSILTVLVFTGLTAWDVQKFKRLGYMSGDRTTLGRFAILGALNLYLDFINIFLAMLQLFGRRR